MKYYYIIDTSGAGFLEWEGFAKNRLDAWKQFRNLNENDDIENDYINDSEWPGKRIITTKLPEKYRKDSDMLYFHDFLKMKIHVLELAMKRGDRKYYKQILREIEERLKNEYGREWLKERKKENDKIKPE